MPRNEPGIRKSVAVRIDEYLEDPVNMRRAAIAVLSVAAILRIAWASLVRVSPVSDSAAYDAFARNIAAGNGFCWTPGTPTAYWPVGTSAIYALLYLLFGYSYIPIVILNIVLGVSIVALTISLSRHWLTSTAAIAAGALMAIWPLLIEFTTILASELFFIFFIMTALWLAERKSMPALPRWIITGLSLAAASYIRPLAMVLFVLFYIPDLLILGRKSRFLPACLVTGAAMLLAIAPWAYRNYLVFDHLVPISTNGGSNFWMGNNPETGGGYMRLPQLEIENEVDRDNKLKDIAIEYIKKEPLSFIGRTARKALILHDRETIGVVWNEKGLTKAFGAPSLNGFKIVSSLYWYAVLGLGAIGLIFLIRNKGVLQALLSPPVYLWLYFLIVHSVTVVNDRYHMPSIPFIALLAGYALASPFRKAKAGSDELSRVR